eukprot:m.430639 g.430639  ORF g.430639 m.430639 type:complete len:340 (+) comp17193_c0_seq1:1044-2063(+)
MAEPLVVTVSGAAGQIGYSLLPLLANGHVFGARKVHLRLLDINMFDIPEKLEGVRMELEDGSYPNLLSVTTCVAELEKAFKGCDVFVATGGFPRKQGMERKDLIAKNAPIFAEQGAAIEEFASKDIKVVVIANPANTNCLLLKSAAPSIPAENFTALTYLDHNRARSQIAMKLGVTVDSVKRTCIWGNHSSTQVPDASNAVVAIGGVVKDVRDALQDDEWLDGAFVTTVQKRGAAIIEARKASSAMSAANAIGDHLRSWLATGTKEDDFVSLAVISDGSYGIAPGIIYSFPVQCKGDGSYTIVQGLEIPRAKQEAMKASEAELLAEKADADQIIATGSA